MTPKEQRNEHLAQTIIKNLQRRHIEGFYCPTGKEAVKKVMELNAPKICYISCDPATLARDLKMLAREYEIEEVTPADLFPNASHVETVCRLYHQKKDFISVPYEPRIVE